MIHISIIIPVLNEADNIHKLVRRIAKSLDKQYVYELIFIDDHSQDDTKNILTRLKKAYPIKYYLKQGLPGKAQSLLEGFKHAQYGYVAMIDSDLQYPPEDIPRMVNVIEEGADVVVAQRTDLRANRVRKIISKAFNTIFCHWLHGFTFDVQSGLKVFRKEIIDRVSLNPSPWSFDLEFLLAARAAGYKITSVPIKFGERMYGNSKVHLVRASIQIGLSALRLKLANEPIIPFHGEKEKAIGQGFHYKRTEFVHFSNLHVSESAVRTLLSHQQLMLFSFLFILIAGLLINTYATLISFIAIITILYFSDLVFNFILIYRSFIKLPEIKVTQAQINEIKDWPIYTIFCPLYKEWEVVSQFVRAIETIDYPKDRLQVQLLLEEDDVDTINHVRAMNIPSYFEIVVVPDTLPKTKPKACNYGLRYARGSFAVIYDAEDMPDPLQLKKAVVAFQRMGSHIACIQAKLNYYNTDQNLLTRLFTAEYSLWFDLILTGLQSLNAPIPLGGTSNHFRVAQLREVKGWDSFNVTEDCDLGIRLVKKGYQTAIMDSVTLEEANSHAFNWLNQRSRWIKGYIQTYLVHMREPEKMLDKNFKGHFLTFQLVVGCKILSLFINPLMWITTLSYFLLRATIGPTIEQFFPGPIFYMGVFSLVVGNFLYLYYYMIGCAKRKQFSLVKYVFLVPVYWLAMSIAAWKGLIQLIGNPHYWPKTKHGLHIGKYEPVTA